MARYSGLEINQAFNEEGRLINSDLLYLNPNNLSLGIPITASPYTKRKILLRNIFFILIVFTTQSYAVENLGFLNLGYGSMSSELSGELSSNGDSNRSTNTVVLIEFELGRSDTNYSIVGGGQVNLYSTQAYKIANSFHGGAKYYFGEKNFDNLYLGGMYHYDELSKSGFSMVQSTGFGGLIGYKTSVGQKVRVFCEVELASSVSKKFSSNSLLCGLAFDGN